MLCHLTEIVKNNDIVSAVIFSQIQSWFWLDCGCKSGLKIEIWFISRQNVTDVTAELTVLSLAQLQGEISHECILFKVVVLRATEQ